MLFFSICLLALLGLSLTTFAEPRRTTSVKPSPYAHPPVDWPDVPVHALGLFRREGRINQPLPEDRPIRRPVQRFQNFDETQSYVLNLVDPKRATPPLIALQLSEVEGPEWTDVMLDGRIVAHVATHALTARDEPRMRRAG